MTPIIKQLVDLLGELGEEGEVRFSINMRSKSLQISSKTVNHETRQVGAYEHHIALSAIALAEAPDYLFANALQVTKRAFQNHVA